MTARPARRSLAGAFRPGAPASEDRAVGLVGLLPPRDAAPTGRSVPRVNNAEPVDASDAPVGGTSRAHHAPDLAGDLVNPGSDLEPPAPASRVRNVAIYLPLDLLRRLRVTARSRELTYADVLVEAASAHLDEVAPRLAPAPPPARDGGMPSRAPRRAPAPGVQVQFRLDGHQVAWLDEQAARFGASSRTALVAALLSAHLGSAEPA